MTAADYNLWWKTREYPWDEKEVPRPRTPHPKPKMPARTGDWLTEFGITTFPQAPKGWKLVQRLAEGYGMHSVTGKPLKSATRSLSLAYLHLGTAQGATAILHFKAGAKKDGSGSWRFVEGYRWDLCTEIDCDHDRNHLTAELLREVGADEVKAVLSGDVAAYMTEHGYVLEEGRWVKPTEEEGEST